MRSAEKFLLSVCVHERQAEISRLLESIAGNNSLRGCPLLVINNARTPETIDGISQICANVSGPQQTEVNRHSWPKLRSAIVQTNGAERPAEFDWLHNARNIGLIAAGVLFPECCSTLHLDSDIEIPETFALDDIPPGALTCLQIDGCPDLSRLEWIALLTFSLARSYSLTHSSHGQQYSLEIASRLPPAHIETILDEFTDVPTMRDGRTDGRVLSFPTREEYHGACFIASSRLLERCPFPHWFDNDWFVFQELRSPGASVEFLPQRVTHRSARKKVFDRWWLLQEENGKILNCLHKRLVQGKPIADECRGSAMDERVAIIEGLLELARRVGEAPLTAPEGASISCAITALEHLLTDVRDLKTEELLHQLRSFYSLRKSWETWFEAKHRLANCQTEVGQLYG
jgi:hypothetical protein